MQNNALQHFFTEMRQFQTEVAKLTDQQNLLVAKKDKLKAVISQASQFQQAELNGESELMNAIQQLKTAIAQSFHQWDVGVEKTLPMQQLSAQYQDRIMFLVFGKVNAGKSSFTNQVVEMYRQLFPEDTIRHFCFKGGAVVDLDADHFQEGFTETTAQIQGVELGKNFVLLDSPGLHSITDENGDLTRQFIDSADAVLWLTPSTSPGQVQELHDLKAELEKGKPLLPIITRSDILVEDWDNEKDEFIKTLNNKSPENRALQENDVAARLSDFQDFKLDRVEKPISISVHAYKQNGDLDSAGLARLFQQMSQLIGQAGTYKMRKADATVQNFLKENVVSSLNVSIKPKIIAAKAQADTAIQRLQTNQTRIANKVTSYVDGQLFDIVNKHKESRDKAAIMAELGKVLNHSLNAELTDYLTEFTSSIQAVSASLDQSRVSDFADNTVKYEIIKGSRAQSLATSGGAIGGAAAGAALGSAFPIVGNIIGGIIGGIFGGLFGSRVVRRQTEWITEVIGVSSLALENSLKTQVAENVPDIVAQSIAAVVAQIQPLQQVCQQLETEIDRFIQSVTSQQAG